MPRSSILVAGLVAGVAALGAGRAARDVAAQQVNAPKFAVDPLWPKPLPNHWILGSAVGVAVDSHDHVFVLNLANSFNRRTEIGAAVTPPTGECCVPAPSVLEFDPDGNLVGHWGGPGQGYEWPASSNGIAIDDKDNVWIGGGGDSDTKVLKFSHDGKFIAGMDGFAGPADVSFDAKEREAYVADGYRRRRVAVVDMTTGAVKRSWGAYGKAPDDSPLTPYAAGSAPARQFRGPVSCSARASDGLVYVCDRASDRIQVFRSNGTFVAERTIAPATLGAGSVWDIAFSADARQRFLYVADGMNMRIHVLDRRSLSLLTSFGDGGRQPGQFFAVHSIATDSKGNVYTAETYEGKRVQRFVFQGIGSVPKKQGVVWAAAARKP